LSFQTVVSFSLAIFHPSPFS